MSFVPWTAGTLLSIALSLGCDPIPDAVLSDAGQRRLDVGLMPSGAGSVKGPGISCPSECSTTYDAETVVELTATPNTGWIFKRWSGGCTGTDPTCTTTISTDAVVIAEFTQGVNFNVVVEGNGEVKDANNQVKCSTGTCSFALPPQTTLTLTGIPDSSWFFESWADSCTGEGACQVTVGDLPKTVRAKFNDGQPVNVTVTGMGSVMSEPAGINCTAGSAGTCTKRHWGSMTLSATVASNWFFGTWQDDCVMSGTTLTCLLDVRSPKTVGALFTDSRTMTVLATGNGTGRVYSTSPDTAIDCGKDGFGGLLCMKTYMNGQSVTLAYQEQTGNNKFLSWGGDCVSFGANATCTLPMDNPKSATATFIKTHQLDIAFTGTAAGVVTFGTTPLTPGNCSQGQGSTCTRTFATGTVVLTAATTPPNTFVKWTGCDSTVNEQCTINLTNPLHQVSVEFKRPAYTAVGSIVSGGGALVGNTYTVVDHGLEYGRAACGTTFCIYGGITP